MSIGTLNLTAIGTSSIAQVLRTFKLAQEVQISYSTERMVNYCNIKIRKDIHVVIVLPDDFSELLNGNLVHTICEYLIEQLKFQYPEYYL